MAAIGTPGDPAAGAPRHRPPTLAEAAEAGDDWPKLATDQIVHVVDVVRDNTTTRALGAASVLKYGIVISVVAAVLLVILVIFVMRAMEAVLVNYTEISDPIWIVYLVTGLISTIVGVYLWRRGERPSRAPRSVH